MYLKLVLQPRCVVGTLEQLPRTCLLYLVLLTKSPNLWFSNFISWRVMIPFHIAIVTVWSAYVSPPHDEVLRVYMRTECVYVIRQIACIHWLVFKILDYTSLDFLGLFCLHHGGIPSSGHSSFMTSSAIPRNNTQAADHSENKSDWAQQSSACVW